jgi:metal-sulfur cluster biosynthetic enzyme
MVTLEEEVRNRVEQIVDPMTGLTFGEMKMIKEVKEERRGKGYIFVL